MPHQRYTNWATMVMHYMRAHNQWLHMACQGVDQVYLTSFQRVSQGLWREYDAPVRKVCYHKYNRAGRAKVTLFSHTVSQSTRQHMPAQATWWAATRPLVDRRLGPERAPLGCGG